jgi:hypothetical protein
MGTACVVVAGCCALSCSAIFLTFVIYMAIFAFSNPDPEAWYGLSTTTTGGVSTTVDELYATEALGTTDSAADLFDIHGRFITWFTWGFLNTMLCCTFFCSAVLIARCA